MTRLRYRFSTILIGFWALLLGACASSGPSVTVTPNSGVATPATTITSTGASATGFEIPEAHMPPPGTCRIWYLDRPVGQQPPPTTCDIARVPPGATLIIG